MLMLCSFLIAVAFLTNSVLYLNAPDPTLSLQPVYCIYQYLYKTVSFWWGFFYSGLELVPVYGSKWRSGQINGLWGSREQKEK